MVCLGCPFMLIYLCLCPLYVPALTASQFSGGETNHLREVLPLSSSGTFTHMLDRIQTLLSSFRFGPDTSLQLGLQNKAEVGGEMHAVHTGDGEVQDLREARQGVHLKGGARHAVPVGAIPNSVSKGRVVPERRGRLPGGGSSRVGAEQTDAFQNLPKESALLEINNLNTLHVKAIPSTTAEDRKGRLVSLLEDKMENLVTPAEDRKERIVSSLEERKERLITLPKNNKEQLWTPPEDMKVRLVTPGDMKKHMVTDAVEHSDAFIDICNKIDQLENCLVDYTSDSVHDDVMHNTVSRPSVNAAKLLTKGESDADPDIVGVNQFIEDIFADLEDKDKEEMAALSLAELVNKDPQILDHFRPSILKKLTDHRKALSIIPTSVLEKILHDPGISRELPPDTLESILDLLVHRKTDITNSDKQQRSGSLTEGSSDETGSKGEGSGDETGSEAEGSGDVAGSKVEGSGDETGPVAEGSGDVTGSEAEGSGLKNGDEDEFADYDVDFGSDDDDDEIPASFITGSAPDTIVDFLENSASPKQLKAILSNSTLLLSLSANTTGYILGKMNEGLAVQMLQGSGVRDLFNISSLNLTQEGQANVTAWQMEVSEHIINRVNVTVLLSLPEFIVEAQLMNSRALRALLNHPVKLAAIVHKNEAIISKLPPDSIVEIVKEDPRSLGLIPTDVFLKLTNCKLVRSLTSEFPAGLLFQNASSQFLDLTEERPELIDCVPDSSLEDFVRVTFEAARMLDQKSHKARNGERTNSLIRAVLTLPDKSLLRIAGMETILIELPDIVILMLVNQRAQLVLQIPKNTLLTLGRKKPWLVGKFNMEAIMISMQRMDVVNELSDRDLANLIGFQPALITIFSTMPTDVVVKFLEKHVDLLDIMPPSAIPPLKRTLQNKELIRAISTDLHAYLSGKPILAQILDKYALLDVLDAHPFLITKMDLHIAEKFVFYLDDPFVRDSLSCATVRVSSKLPELLNIIPNTILTKLLTNSHIMSCLESQDLEKTLAVADLGSRLPLSTLLTSARNLRVSQLSLKSALNFVTRQIPKSNPTLFFH